MEFMILAALLALVALVGMGCFILAVAVAARLLFPGERKRPEAEDGGTDPQQKVDPMDEGFENIMSFSVQGKTGFEE